MATPGQLRCAKCSIVVLDVFPQIMQDLIKDSNVPPISLYHMIMNTEFKKKLKPEEMHSVQTLLSDDFTKLDVSLIYKIVKYFKISIPRPSRNWGSNPQPNEVEIGDDVERIRIARNSFVHKPKADISEEEMKNFFSTFTDVGRRMDKHLKKLCPNGYEQKIQNCRDLHLSSEMAEQTLQVLHEIESLKEMGSIEAGKNEVHIYYGKSMKNIIERIREEKVSGTAPVKFIIYYVENAAEKTEEINCLTQELNANSNYIQLKKATNECIVLYVEMMKDILMNFDTLFCAVTSFLRYVFKRVFLQSEDNEEMLVVMITAEDDLDVYLDSKEPVMQSNPTNLESCSLVLNLEVKNEVFATTEKFENSISEFASKLIKKTNGRQLFPQKDIHVVIQPGESDDIDPTEPDVKSYPTYVKSGDNSLELNVNVKNKTVDTAARVKKSIGANEKQVNRILSELEKIHSSKDKDRDVLVVKNIPKNVTDETLENYLEVICQVEVDHLYFHGLPKCKQVSEVAIVLLKEKLIDLKKIEEKSKRKKIEGQVIQLCRLESPEGVVVFGLPKETTEDELTLYFERKKIAGIDAVVTQCIIHKRIDVGVVQYTDNDTALQNITKVNHRIRDKDLICEPYYSNFHNTVIESLMEFSSDNLSPCDYEYKSGTKHLPTQDEDITYSLGGKLEIVSKTPDEDDPGYARADINRNSKSGSRKSIISQHIAGCKETDDEGYEIAGTVCGINEHEDAFKVIESIQSVHKYYEIPPEVPITPRPSEERREGPCNLEDGYNDEVSIEKGKIILLRMMGFTKMCKECKIDLNTATDVVSFNGSKDAVMEAKLKMFQELEGVTEVTKVVSKGHAAVLKAGSSWIKNTLKQENICAFGSVKGDNLLCIQAFSKREALKGLKNILSCLDVVEISYTELAFDYLNSAEWKEFLKKNTKGSTEIDRQKNVIIIEGTKEECQLEKDIIEWELRKIEAHKLDKIELKESKSLDFPYGQHKQMDRVENELRDTSSDIHAHRRHTVADFRFDARPNYVPYEHRWNTWKWSTHFGSVEVILKQGVISNEKADVLVNVVAVKDNCKFTASRVAKSFVNRSPEFEKRYMLAIQQWDGKGYVLMTENSGIPHCKAICHLHLPTWTGDKSVLTTAISNCFKMCSKMNAQCVAFPPVGFGQLLKYPLDEVISCLIAESKVAAQKSQCIQKIKFVLYEDSTVERFKEKLNESSASGGLWPFYFWK